MSISPFNAALPQTVDARKLAQREQQLAGVLPRESLERVGAAVEAMDGDVRVELLFGRDLQGHLTVSGKLSCDVQLLCQRCLQPMPEQVEAEFLWGIVWSEEQGKALPRELDPVVQDGDELGLHQALEDEILLNLPMVAYHVAECVAREHFHSGEEAGEADGQRENPFKVLEQLKGSSNKP
ncbi:YceD family protein [Microbulbifer thermotolerans]|uniref:Large ribosomal RNA subunit accumulation protein YceD n=1 Tax=Microbulbifer thermotolerans TaxID=252514 RepID=A0A143HMI8_MICTH|nr:YceD family protein [Microbulbifer thermotolerans]AMX02492.1 nucleic acid-binding protein [Microbulbifer thermotolerans]MCX2779345.1 YceD family protein [Microbulbifer thermotolerans]MCX2782451.1 YceD family protein [Microbulbifer thermotolerans]MCX2795036.1 YceD family protein [Microbulbifer thermotolerans]MCX2800604.1 YceD family protein [Microbulbifer thermotolerans]